MKRRLSCSWLTRNIFCMGLVSFFNDMSTEMMYPILPVFLTSTLGVSPAIVGLIYGIARATENIFCFFFGWLSDQMGERKLFVFWGYLISCLAKGLIGFAFHWHLVLFAFFGDRFGKSIRTSPRDVLLVGNSISLVRAKIFGFQRAADTFGAVVGPLCSMVFLSLVGEQLRFIFFITVIPASIAVTIFAFCVRDDYHQAPEKAIHNIENIFKTKKPFFASLGKNYYFFLMTCMIFYLATGVENFFILKSQSLGIALTTTVFVYMIYNLVYALCAYPIGVIADTIGTRGVLFIGFLLFAGVSALFGLAQNHAQIAILFALQGFYMALTKGVVRAHISLISAEENLGFAFGLHSTLSGICMFLGSCGAGMLWSYWDNRMLFFVGSFLAFLAAICIFLEIMTEKFCSSQ